MNIETVVFTVTTPDRPGVIRSVSRAVHESGGNWTESNFTALEGIFVGIVKVDIPAEKKASLLSALAQLQDQGIEINHPREYSPASGKHSEPLTLRLEANDREGIIEEITTALASANINIIDLESRCESASMAGFNLFTAELTVTLPGGCSRTTLVDVLEHISGDVMVAIDDGNTLS